MEAPEPPAPDAGACPKCGGSFERGTLLDHGYGSVTTPFWMPGPVQRGWTGNVKVRRRDLVPTRSLRCEECGYLELYAPTEQG